MPARRREQRGSEAIAIYPGRLRVRERYRDRGGESSAGPPQSVCCGCTILESNSLRAAGSNETRERDRGRGSSAGIPPIFAMAVPLWHARAESLFRIGWCRTDPAKAHEKRADPAAAEEFSVASSGCRQRAAREHSRESETERSPVISAA